MDYRLELSVQMLRHRKGAIIGALLAMTVGILVIHVNYVISYGVYESVIKDFEDFHFGHVRIQDDEDFLERSDTTMVNWIERMPYVEGAAPRLSDIGSINATSYGEKMEKTRVEILGVDPEMDPNASTAHQTIIDGQYVFTRNSAVMGSLLAWELGGVEVGDSIKLKIVDRWGEDTLKRLTVTGISDAPGFSGLETALIVHIDTLREMIKRPGDYDTIIVRLSDPEASEDVRSLFFRSFQQKDYDVKTIQEYEYLEFSGWKEELETYQIIGVFGMISSAFAIVTIQMMFVATKTRQIGIIRAIGGQRYDILIIFIIQGLIIGSLGAAVGTVTGLAFTVYVDEYGLGSGYESGNLVVIYDWNMTIQTALIALAFAVVASFYPAYRATTLQPTEAMRTV